MKKIIYTKFSNDRSPKYSVMTTIELDGEKKYIYKKAMSREAVEHIHKFPDFKLKLEEQYSDAGFHFIEGKLENDRIGFPFVKGRTLEQRIVGFLQDGQEREAIELIKLFVKRVRSVPKCHSFEVSSEFSQIFGTMEFSENLISAAVCDVDLIFENVIAEDDWVVIDYEWTFDFDIPLDFVIFRALYYLLKENHWGLDIEKLYEDFGISTENQKIYAQMEQNFQKYIVGRHTPLYEMRNLIDKPLLPLGTMVQEYQENEERSRIKVYFNDGEGYREDRSFLLESMRNTTGKLSVTLPVESGITEVRIDPMRGSGILYIKSLTNQDGKELAYYHNGMNVGTNIISFEQYDVQLYVMLPEDGKTSQINLEGYLEFGDYVIETELNKRIQEVQEDIRQYQKQLVEQQELMMTMKQEQQDMEKELQDKEKELQDKEKELQDKEKEHQNVEIELQDVNNGLEQQIALMRSTKIWRCYEKYTAVKNKFRG